MELKFNLIRYGNHTTFKLDGNFTYKVKFVLDGYETLAPKSLTYYSIVSQKSVQMIQKYLYATFWELTSTPLAERKFGLLLVLNEDPTKEKLIKEQEHCMV